MKILLVLAVVAMFASVYADVDRIFLTPGTTPKFDDILNAKCYNDLVKKDTATDKAYHLEKMSTFDTVVDVYEQIATYVYWQTESLNAYFGTATEKKYNVMSGFDKNGTTATGIFTFDTANENPHFVNITDFANLQRFQNNFQQSRFNVQRSIDGALERVNEDSEGRLETLTENGATSFLTIVPAIGDETVCNGENCDAAVQHLVEVIHTGLTGFFLEFTQTYFGNEKNIDVKCTTGAGAQEINEARDALEAMLSIFTSTPQLNIVDVYREYVVARDFFLEKIKVIKTHGLLLLEAAEEGLEGVIKNGMVEESIIHFVKKGDPEKIIYDIQPDTDLEDDFTDIIKFALENRVHFFDNVHVGCAKAFSDLKDFGFHVGLAYPGKFEDHGKKHDKFHLKKEAKATALAAHKAKHGSTKKVGTHTNSHKRHTKKNKKK